MKRLVWTRSRADWRSDSELFADAGAQVLHLPCLRTEACALELPEPYPRRFILTSAKGVRYALAHEGVKAALEKARAIATHGAKTAKALREAGLEPQHYDQIATGEELAQTLTNDWDRDTPIGVVTAETPAYDITAHLQGAGYVAHRLAAYRTVSELTDANGRPLPAATVERYLAQLSGCVAFASPSAVEGFVSTLDPSREGLGTRLIAAVIGPTTEKAAAPYFGRIVAPDQADVGSLARVAGEVLRASPSE